MEWKDNAPYVLCLSHDVDRIKKQWYHYLYYGIRNPSVQLKSLLAKIAGREPYWNFEELVELEANYGAKSTFFFLNERHRELSANFMGRYKITSKRVCDIIRLLDRKGFEIGLHGSYYSYKDEALLRQEKDTLEGIVGHEIISTRQHHLNFEEGKTWDIHKKLGIKYDSTSGYSKQVGFNQAERTAEGIIEIPITLMDTVDLTEGVYNQCCQVAQNGGIVMLNFHQCHFNALEYPRNVMIYSRLLTKAKNDGAWITNVKEIGEWLDERL